MDNLFPKLITWTYKTTHLLFDPSVIIDGQMYPGTLCGRYPKRKGKCGTWGGKSHDYIVLAFGSPHLRWGRMKFCLDCTRKLFLMKANRIADKYGLQIPKSNPQEDSDE